MLSQRKESSFVLVLYALIAILLFRFNPFADQYLVPTDLLYHAAGIREEVPLEHRVKPISGARSDAIDGILPALAIWKSELVARGHFSQWNPYAAAGEPAYANMTMGIFSIRNLPLLLFDVPTAFSIGTILLLMTAGFGTFLFLRRKTGILPAFFGGLVFMFSGFNMAWTPWPQFQVSAVIPWMFLGASLIFDRRLCLGFAVTVIATWQLIVGGFPSVTGYAVYALFISSVIVFGLALSKRRPDSLKLGLFFLGALLLGVLCAAHQLIPFVEYMQQFDIMKGRGAAGRSLGAVRWLLTPFRNPRGLYPEDTSYVGHVTLILVAIAPFLYFFRRSRPRSTEWNFYSLWIWFVVLAFFFVAIYTFPKFLFYGLHAHLPVFSNNPSGRALSVFGFAMAVAASLSAQAIYERFLSDTPRRRRWAVSLFCLAILGHIADVKTIVRVTNAVNPKFTFYPETPPIQFMKEGILPGQWIIATRHTVLVNGTLTAHSLVDPFSHAFFRQSDKELFGHLVDSPWITSTASQFNLPAVKLTSPWMKVLSVRYIWTTLDELHAAGPLPKNWRVAFTGSATVVLENMDVVSPAYWTSQDPDSFRPESETGAAGQVKATDFSNDRRTFDVEAESAGHLVIPARGWPGFKARVNGDEVQWKSLGASIATVPVPSGKSIVEWSYEPMSLRVGIWLSSGAWLAAFAVMFFLRRKSKISS